MFLQVLVYYAVIMCSGWVLLKYWYVDAKLFVCISLSMMAVGAWLGTYYLHRLKLSLEEVPTDRLLLLVVGMVMAVWGMGNYPSQFLTTRVSFGLLLGAWSAGLLLSGKRFALWASSKPEPPNKEAAPK
jgi:uncharacterized membrane protein